MDPQPLLCSDDSLLLIIDMQPRLGLAMKPADWTRVQERTSLLVRAASALRVPIAVTHHYPQGLETTDPAINRHLPCYTHYIEKSRFSACGTEEFDSLLDKAERHQIVVCGMESHVCVLQTAFGLASNGYTPFIVGDAVCSRDDNNRTNALERMQRAGIDVTNCESVIFEWLRDASHPQFKSLLPLVK